MTEPPRSRRHRIFQLALPIIGGMASQNILNLVDTMMVGGLGDASLAGVGIASFANFMSMAFISGLAAGVQAVSSRRLGEGRESEMAVPLNGGLLMALAVGVPITVVLTWLAPTIFPLLADKPDIVREGLPYWQARLFAVTAIGMNFSFRGYWNGVNLSRLYFRTLVVMHIINVALNYTLIFGKLGMPALGTLGAGIGSTIATWLGTLYYIAQALKHAKDAGFLRGIPARDDLKTMARLAVPAGLQQFFFAAGMTAFFAIVARVGVRELSASNVLLNLLLVAILPSIAFGIASASLVGQALGRNDADDASRWAWDVVKVAIVVICVLVLPALVAPQLLLHAFLRDDVTRLMATTPLRLIAVSMPIDTVGIVLMQSLMGAGATRSTLAVSVGGQWLVTIPAVLVAGPVLHLGLTGIWAAFLLTRGVQTLLYVMLWRRGAWTSVQV